MWSPNFITGCFMNTSISLILGGGGDDLRFSRTNFQRRLALSLLCLLKMTYWHYKAT